MEAKFIKKVCDKYVLTEKHKYYGQIQLGMALLNLEKCYFALYASFDKSILIVEVNFNYEFAKRMLSTVKSNFFEKMIHNLCHNELLDI